MQPTTITFTSAGNPFQAELFNPSIVPSGKLIIIAHGSDGLVDN
jgi:hypothetical protein